MKRKIALAVAVLVIAASAGGLALAADGNDDADNGADTGMANPASVFCEERGGTVEIQRGICQFGDGSEIEEWEYWRQFHGSSVDAPETGGLTPLAPQGLPEPDPSDMVLFIDGEPVTPFNGDINEQAIEDGVGASNGMAVPGFEGNVTDMVVDTTN